MQDNFPIQQDGLFLKIKLKRLPFKTAYLFVEWEVIWQASDSPFGYRAPWLSCLILIKDKMIETAHEGQ